MLVTQFALVMVKLRLTAADRRCPSLTPRVSSTHPPGSPTPGLAGQPPSATQWSATSQLVYGHRQAQCYVDRDEGGLQVPWYLLINGAEPRWRLHDTVDSADLEKSLARGMENGVIVYTLASRNEGETFQSLTINGKNLVTYVITEEDDPDPAKTRSRYEAAGF